MVVESQLSTRIFRYLIVIAALSVIIISTGSFNSLDTLHRLQVTRWLWKNEPQVIESDQDRQYVALNEIPKFAGVDTYSAIGRDGKRYVTWGIGQSLVMLPADIIAFNLVEFTNPKITPSNEPNYSVTRQDKGLNKKKIAGIVSYLTFPLINTLAIITCFYLLKSLGFHIVESAYGCLGLIFCSTFLPYAQTHQENSLDFLLTASGYLFHSLWLMTNSYKFLWIGMGTLGFNLLIRLPLLVNLISVNIFTGATFYFNCLSNKFIPNQSNAFQGHSLHNPKTIRTVLNYLAIALCVYGTYFGIDRFYQWLRFGNFTSNYTSIWATQVKQIYPQLHPNFPFSNDFLSGFLGFLFSTDRSTFLFNPLIIVTGYISLKNWRKIAYPVRAFIMSLIFLLLITITFYASWFLWGGAGAWGSRYTANVSQFMVLLAIPLAMKFPLKHQLEKLGFRFLVIISGLIQISSVLLNANLELAQNLFVNLGVPLEQRQHLFTIGQRFINILAVITGNFDKWNLRPLNIPLEESQSFITLSFFPWSNAPQFLSPNIVLLLQISWILLLVIVLVFIWQLIKICHSYYHCSSHPDSLN